MSPTPPAPEHGTSLTALLIEGVRRADSGIAALVEAHGLLATKVEAGRREDVMLLGEKIERGFERVASDAREREGRLSARLDALDLKLSDVRDKSLEAHQALQDEVDDIRNRLDTGAAKPEGRKEVLGVLRSAGRFVVQNGRELALGFGLFAVSLKAFWPPAPTAYAEIPPPQPPRSVRVDQPRAPSDVTRGEDWPLELRGRD